MTERYCEICQKRYDGYTWTIEMNYEKCGILQISGHKDCIDKLYDKIKKVKNREKKTIKQVLNEVGFKKES